jgi:hypothetical protein
MTELPRLLPDKYLLPLLPHYDLYYFHHSVNPLPCQPPCLTTVMTTALPTTMPPKPPANYPHNKISC